MGDVNLSPTRGRYVSVNGSWPAGPLPKLTGQEAVSAGKRLYRLAMGRAFKGEVQITSGNRYNWIRRGVLYVNPDRGWTNLVHDLSHYFHNRIAPNQRPHGWRHAGLERLMTTEVVTKGWLDGALKSKTADKPKLGVKQKRAQNVDARIAAWQGKLKRAQNALKKLRQQKRYYDKTLSA